MKAKTNQVVIIISNNPPTCQANPVHRVTLRVHVHSKLFAHPGPPVDFADVFNSPSVAHRVCFEPLPVILVVLPLLLLGCHWKITACKTQQNKADVGKPRPMAGLLNP